MSAPDLHRWLVDGNMPDKWRVPTVADPMRFPHGLQRQIDRARAEIGEARWQELNKEYDA